MKKIIYTIYLLAFAAEAHADQNWGAATHFGFAVVDRSSTGLEKAQGSMMFFDVFHQWDAVSFGLRSITQGGKGDSLEYYRLGAGPVVKWQLDTWTLHGSMGAFKETALDADGGEAYRSDGQSFLVGWQRSKRLADNAALTWGGFVTGHQGGMTAVTSYQGQSKSNTGLSHGIEISIRMGL